MKKLRCGSRQVLRIESSMSTRRRHGTPLPDFFLSQVGPTSILQNSTCGSSGRKVTGSLGIPRQPAQIEERRGGSGKGRVILFSSRGTVASDPAIHFASKISGRPCVGGNPGRAAHKTLGECDRSGVLHFAELRIEARSDAIPRKGTHVGDPAGPAGSDGLQPEAVRLCPALQKISGHAGPP
jgi:hypothetical protein